MSQYSLIIPGLYCRGLVKRLCHNTKFFIVTVDWAVGRAGRRWARGWVRRRSVKARRQLGCWGDRRAGASGREQARERGRTRRQQARRGAKRRRQCARQAQQAWARGALGVGAGGTRRGHACARRLGVLAGLAGPSWCTVHLA